MDSASSWKTIPTQGVDPADKKSAAKVDNVDELIAEMEEKEQEQEKEKKERE